jgi:hypothetical protein
VAPPFFRSDAWLSFLRLGVPPDIYRRLLGVLHERVVGAMANPLLLSDFLTASLDRGVCQPDGQTDGQTVGLTGVHGGWTGPAIQTDRHTDG